MPEKTRTEFYPQQIRVITKHLVTAGLTMVMTLDELTTMSPSFTVFKYSGCDTLATHRCFNVGHILDREQGVAIL
ncbi:hypothetical protein OK016_22795 [Vibrio chagasii]|nr:hypothetical protein [Vibrio chagasii]